jgi:hypothetical protein
VANLVLEKMHSAQQEIRAGCDSERRAKERTDPAAAAAGDQGTASDE